MTFKTFLKDLLHIKEPWILQETKQHHLQIRTYSFHLCPIQALYESLEAYIENYKDAGFLMNLSEELVDGIAGGSDGLKGYELLQDSLMDAIGFRPIAHLT